MMRSVILCFFATAIVCVLQAGQVHAAGGMCVDNFTVTNNGLVVFSDNFESKNLNKWLGSNDATILDNGQLPRNSFLLLNRHTPKNAYAYSKLPLIKSPGVVELKAAIWLPAPSDQWGWSREQKKWTWALFSLGSVSRNYNIAAGTCLYPGERAYRIWIRLSDDRPQNDQVKSMTKPFLSSGVWAALTLRLDQKTGTAYALLDGKQLCTISYNPDNFRSIKSANVLTWFGDGAQIR